MSRASVAARGQGEPPQAEAHRAAECATIPLMATTPAMRMLARLALVGAAASTAAGCNDLRALFPGSAHDSTPPRLPAELARPAVLVFSKTAGYRHEEAIPAGLAMFEEIAQRRGWGLFASENGAVHEPERLGRFDAVVWHQVSGDVLDPGQREALRAWIRAGGGFVGIHGTGGDSEYAWTWHPDVLVGALFTGHPINPQFQEARVVVEDRTHPATRHLDATWVRTDEWYSFAESPRGKGVRVLASLDEKSYRPLLNIPLFERDLSMGNDHPIIWSHCIGEGRVFYSALGHLEAAYSEPAHVTLLEEALAWALGLHGTECRHPIAGQEAIGPDR